VVIHAVHDCDVRHAIERSQTVFYLTGFDDSALPWSIEVLNAIQLQDIQQKEKTHINSTNVVVRKTSRERQAGGGHNRD
jgi:hypothetical protein